MLLERASRLTFVCLEGFLWISIGGHAGGRGHFIMSETDGRPRRMGVPVRTVRIAVKLAASKGAARPERRLAMKRLVLGLRWFVCGRLVAALPWRGLVWTLPKGSKQTSKRHSRRTNQPHPNSKTNLSNRGLWLKLQVELEPFRSTSPVLFSHPPSPKRGRVARSSLGGMGLGGPSARHRA